MASIRDHSAYTLRFETPAKATGRTTRRSSDTATRKPATTRPVPPACEARPHPATVVTATYDPDEFEFMQAVDRFKASTGRKFPTCSDMLAIAKSLGYARTGCDQTRTTGRKGGR